MSRGRAFTLVELLAVIVTLSLVASVGAAGLAASGERARLNAAAAQWRDLDARARLFGRSVGPVVMRLDEQGRNATLRTTRSEDLLASLALPVPGRMRVDGRPAESVVFDRLGRSRDYQVELRGDARVVRWEVCGLTGFVVEGRP